MKPFGRYILTVVLFLRLGNAVEAADQQSIPPPPKVRAKSQELYSLHPLCIQAKVIFVDTNNPIKYEIGGRQYRRWGYPATVRILEQTGNIWSKPELDVVIPGYTIQKGPRRSEWHEKKNNFTQLTPEAEAYLALTRHADGYWLVAAVLNRHDFAELKTIGERVALTGRDDTIGVRKSSFRLQMNPMQQAYMAAEKQVRAGEMTAAEFDRQFTPEMRQAVFDPNNADLVLGRE
ncbi:MAG: hypothetical protein ACOX3F_05045 [Kiritimatiellia bacterium]|jgi:hypothetical protein